MEKLKIFIYLIFITLNIFSQECYVTAKSGLNVREKPNINSEKIGKLKFKEKIEIIKTTYKNLSVTDNGKKVNGYWIKIKNKNVEGYVFDGFLEFSNFNKEFLNFTNKEFFVRISKENIDNLNPNNKWVYFNSCCCGDGGFQIERGILNDSYGNDSDSFRIISIEKLSQNEFKLNHLKGDFVPGNERIIKILDRKNKIVELNNDKDHRYISSSNLDFYKKIDVNDCYEGE